MELRILNFILKIKKSKNEMGITKIKEANINPMKYNMLKLQSYFNY